jgi:hypothetical protein
MPSLNPIANTRVGLGWVVLAFLNWFIFEKKASDKHLCQ